MLLTKFLKMKKYYTLLLLFIIGLANAQNGITYQAVILNPNSEELPGADNSRLPIINQSICLDFKIINAASQVDYQETLTTKTDEFGMVNVIIGTGTRKAGIATLFKNINWDGTAKNLVVSFDPTGNCTQFIEISNQPFTYVPYALYAANGGATGPQGPAGPAGTNGLDGKTVLNGTSNPSASLGTNGDFYINTTTNSLFGPKANNLWGNSVSLVGPQGIQGLQGPQGVAGSNGLNGTNGVDGLSAYQIWLNAGNTGNEAQFLTALRGATGAQGPQGVAGPAGGPQGPAGANGVNGSNGLSAYQIWLNAGNTGTEAQFITALRGATGAQGPQGIQGIQGLTGPQGTAGINGTNGLSAYQIWLNAGNIGTEAQFLTALRGATGAQGSQGNQGVAGPTGPTGATGPQGTSGINGTNGTNGIDGLSAYQIWLNAGNTGTEAQFLTALRGATGAQGPQGIQGSTGPAGATGPQGTSGTNGSNGTNGNDGLSAYQIWLNAGNTGTEAQFITSLRGATGAQGSQGIQGVQGPTGTTGNNGKNTLVTTTVEAAGANCAAGGTKIEVGLDANSNGVLESGEVNSSLTKYICNGNQSIINNTSGYEQFTEILNQGYSIAPNQNITIAIPGINSKHIYLTLVTGHKIYTESAISIEALDSNNNRINISNDFIYVEKSGSAFNGVGGTVNFEANRYNDTLFYKSFRIPNPNNTSPSGILKLDIYAENNISKINIILVAGRNENINYSDQNITPNLIVKKVSN